jgi:hypothetical protein
LIKPSEHAVLSPKRRQDSQSQLLDASTLKRRVAENPPCLRIGFPKLLLFVLFVCVVGHSDRVAFGQAPGRTLSNPPTGRAFPLTNLSILLLFSSFKARSRGQVDGDHDTVYSRCFTPEITTLKEKELP